jgi:hypothetical protein
MKEGAEDSETPDDELDDVKQCADILSLAGELLEIINRHRHTSSIPWDARIGISLGNAVAGVLGDRQKGFSVQGEAIQHIAQLEPQGKPGKAHCSADFFNVLSKRDVGKRLLKYWVVEKVVLGNSQEASCGQVEAGSHLLSSTENHQRNGNFDNFESLVQKTNELRLAVLELLWQDGDVRPGAWRRPRQSAPHNCVQSSISSQPLHTKFRPHLLAQRLELVQHSRNLDKLHQHLAGTDLL